MNQRNDLRVGIFIPTRNQSAFLIRQLEYYALKKSPHTVYIGDSSDEEQAQTLQRAIVRLQSTIPIVYRFFAVSQYGIIACERELLAMVEEEYVVFNGDDDYHVPEALTACAQFLAGHPEYNSAHGLGISFHLLKKGPQGVVGGFGKYPLPTIEEDTAVGRVMHHFRKYICSFFAVHRTASMREYWRLTDGLADDLFAGELLPSFLSVADGKSKSINCLQVVRHGRYDKQRAHHLFRWMTSEQWLKSYLFFREGLASRIVQHDDISLAQAQTLVEQGFWGLLVRFLSTEYEQRYAEHVPQNMRQRITRLLPFLRTAYCRAHHYLPLSQMSLFPFISSYHEWRQLVKSFSTKE